MSERGKGWPRDTRRPHRQPQGTPGGHQRASNRLARATNAMMMSTNHWKGGNYRQGKGSRIDAEGSGDCISRREIPLCSRSRVGPESQAPVHLLIGCFWRWRCIAVTGLYIT